MYVIDIATVVRETKVNVAVMHLAATLSLRSELAYCDISTIRTSVTLRAITLVHSDKLFGDVPPYSDSSVDEQSAV